MRETRIAIVGAGVGGGFSAHWMRTLGLDYDQVLIDVYESSARVGGRTMDTSALGESADRAVELGASMAIVQNRYVADAAAELGIRRTLASDGRGRGGGRMAIVGGPPRQLNFRESAWPPVTVARLAWRYGMTHMARLHRQGQEFIANFSKLYDAQDAGDAFRSPDELLRVGAMEEWPRRSCADAIGALVGEGAAIEELVAGLVANNYGARDWRRTGALCCFTAVAPLAAGPRARVELAIS